MVHGILVIRFDDDYVDFPVNTLDIVRKAVLQVNDGGRTTVKEKEIILGVDGEEIGHHIKVGQSILKD